MPIQNHTRKHHTRFLMFLTPIKIAELIQELEKSLQLKVLKLVIEISGRIEVMKQEVSKVVQNKKYTMNYPPKTAGRIMTNCFVCIPQHFNIQESVEKFKIFAEFSND